MNEQALQDCIRHCWECRHHCQTELYTYCLQEGGEHAQAGHVKLMTDSIQICQISADFMTRQSEYHEATCRACAEICRACAASCREIGMDDCADICQACADSCAAMAGASHS